MKGRKLLALLLALTLWAGLAIPVGAAEATHESFNDLMVINPVTNDYQWKWAWPTVDDAIRRGLFIGYTPYQDAEGNTITNFGPGDAVTEAVGLTLCARMIADASQRETILKDRLEQMRTLIPGTDADPDDVTAPYMWFRKEAAACLELGVISAEDLTVIRDADRLGKPMAKADFAVYLVRAMGLEDFAKSLNASDLSFFADEAKIGREYRPYVKLLYNYGVLTGDENQNFNPNQGMNRAVCATMLSRAIENILEERGVAVELGRYTTYPFAAGTIRDVSMGDDGVRTVTLEELSGAKSYKLPASAQIYQNNMPAKATDLKNGSFAKLVFNDNGEVAVVRLTPAGFLSQVEGTCTSVGDEAVVVDDVTYAVDRFTQVEAGGQTGDRSVIDPDAGYTDAKLVVNSRKTVLSMTLTGGTRLVDGILADVTTTTQGAASKTTATVNSFSGLPTIYNVTTGVAFTAKGQELEALKESFKGKHVTLRVAADDLSDVKSVDVDLDSQYIQGVLQIVNATATPKQVQITRTGDTKKTPYEVDDDCVITYEGKDTLLKSLPIGIFVTAKLEGAVITQISAWTGLESVSGTLTAITYADPAILTITTADSTKSDYSLSLDELSKVVILVDGEDGDFTDLHTGDSVVITLRYHNITQIDVTPRAADVTGTLDAITFKNGAPTVLSVRLSDGTVGEYTASENITVTRDGKPALLTDVKAGSQVSMVTSDSKVLSLQFSGATVSQTSVEGKIISVDTTERIITVLPDGADAVPVKAYIPSGITTIVPIEGGTALTISRLSAGDTVLFFGSYDAKGVFQVKSGVRK